MYYPSTNQIGALLGRRITPDYQSYIQPQVAALPQYLQLKESRNYNDAMRDLEQQRINQQQSQFNQNYALAQEQADAAKKNQMIANLISGGGLALNAYQALDESGVDLSDAGRALSSVLPSSDSMSSVASVVDPPMRATDFSGAPSTLSQLSSGVNDWVVEPVSQAAEGVGEFFTESVPSAVKYVTGGDMWSDVSGFVEGLFS